MGDENSPRLSAAEQEFFADLLGDAEEAVAFFAAHSKDPAIPAASQAAARAQLAERGVTAKGTRGGTGVIPRGVRDLRDRCVRLVQAMQERSIAVSRFLPVAETFVGGWPGWTSIFADIASGQFHRHPAIAGDREGRNECPFEILNGEVLCPRGEKQEVANALVAAWASLHYGRQLSASWTERAIGLSP